jgi:hypothetical protein
MQIIPCFVMELTQIYNCSDTLHLRVKSISTLRYFPIYFIQKTLISKHSPEVTPYMIFITFSALDAEVN